MKRRDFLASSVAASSLAALSLGGAASAAEGRDYYELRLYHFKDDAKLKVMSDLLRDAVLPAAKRLGIGPVGAFTAANPEPSPTLYVLIVHPSLEAFGSAMERLAQDRTFREDAAGYLIQPATDPVYLRMESSLMRAFEGMPKITVPAKGEKPRVFELRTYESATEVAGRKKIEMFHSGEFDIFKRAGFTQVFYGETLVGTRLPNLTYMLSSPDRATHDKGWGAFGADPQWKSLSADPQYANTVSKVSNWFLTPTPYSQI